MRKLSFVSILVLVLLGIIPSAWSAVFHVSPTSDSDCSDFNCDFQSALDAASANDEEDTIYLIAGTYNASAASFTYTTDKIYPFTVIGSEGAVIDGSNASRCMLVNAPQTSSPIFIKNIIFMNCNAPTAGGGLDIAPGTAGLTVEDCSFINNTAQDGGGLFVLANNGGPVTVKKNSFRGNLATNFVGGGAYIVGSADSVVIENNVFLSNGSKTHGAGVYVVTGSGNISFMNNSAYTNTAQVMGGGVLLATTSGAVNVTNNTFTADSAAAGGGIYLSLNSNAAVADINNNIIWDNKATNSGNDIFVCDNCNSITATAIVNLYNNDFTDFYSQCANTIGCTPRITQGNNKSVDPQFVNVSDPDPANWDLRPSFGSECIDTGNNSTCPATDIRGIPRPQDGDRNGSTICDMGAYEAMPVDLSVSEGTIGTHLTINTSFGFGTKKGKAFIGNAATKIISWSDTEIICTVKKVPLPAGANNVTIKPSSRTETSLTLTSAFTARSPVIDSVILGHGSPGDRITIFGRFFSTKKGKVYLEYVDKNGKTKKKSCRIITWEMNAQTGSSTITFEVPKGLDLGFSYPLYIKNKVGEARSAFTIDP